MNINWNYIKTFLLIGVVFFLFAFAKKRSNNRVLSEVNVSFTNDQNLYLTEQAVNKLLIQNEVQVNSVDKEALDLSGVETLIEAHEMVENAEVFMTIDGRLGTSVTQRQPLARVMSPQQYYLDRNGTKMPLSRFYSARVPLLTGVSENELKEVFPLIEHISQDEFLEKHVTGIHRFPGGKYQIRLRKLDFFLAFGTITDVERKFRNFKAFYQKAMQDKKLDAYEKVDLQFGDQVVCTKK